MAGIELSERLSQQFDLSLPGSLLSDYPTPASISSHIQSLSPLVQADNDTDCGSSKMGSGLLQPPTGTLSSGANLTLNSRPCRCLMLHGRAANAQLMEDMMRTTGWLGRLATKFEFFFIDAVHEHPALPEFYQGLTDVGLYGAELGQTYYDYGCAFIIVILSLSYTSAGATTRRAQHPEHLGRHRSSQTSQSNYKTQIHKLVNLEVNMAFLSSPLGPNGDDSKVIFTFEILKRVDLSSVIRK